MVFIYCVLSFFSDAADNEHSYLVEIPVERSIFELRFVDIWNCNDRYQRLVNDERQVTRVELKIFTRFVFKLVFRVSGRSVPWDKSLTFKRTGVHNLNAIFKCFL